MAVAKFPIVVIGASSGGMEALRRVLSGMSETVPAAIAVVVHIGPFSVELPQSVRRWTALPVDYARDGESLTAGHVYLAPPDRHLLVDDDHLLLSHGPRENFTRPAVDPLFRSAAEFFGPMAIGVILSGNLSDGTAGLWEIKRRGGIAIVQDPKDAEYPGMPQSAAQHVQADYCVKAGDIGALVSKLAVRLANAPQSAEVVGEGPMSYSADKPVALVCPECGGAMAEQQIGNFIQYRCHIGHVFGRDDMAAGQLDSLERSFGMSLRLLRERIELCRQASRMARGDQQAEQAEEWDEAAQEAASRARLLTDLLEAGWKRPETR